MEKISSIGAVVLLARDPRALSEWYQRVLGIETEHEPAGDFFHGMIGGASTDAGIRLGILKAEESTEGGAPMRSVMVNYQVDDFDKFLEHLRQQNVTIKEAKDYLYGRFAYIDDPEGNPIELYGEPAS